MAALAALRKDIGALRVALVASQTSWHLAGDEGHRAWLDGLIADQEQRLARLREQAARALAAELRELVCDLLDDADAESVQLHFGADVTVGPVVRCGCALDDDEPGAREALDELRALLEDLQGAGVAAALGAERGGRVLLRRDGVHVARR